MIALNEAQTWTVIGGLLAIIGTMLTLVLTTQSRQIRSIIDVMNARFATVDAKFDAMREVIDTRFASVERRLDGLDRDVAMLVKRLPAE